VVRRSGRDDRIRASGLSEKTLRGVQAICLVTLVIAAAMVLEGKLPGGPAAEAAVVPHAGAAQSQYYPLPRPPATQPPAATPLPLLSPFPVVRIAGRLTRRGVRIRILSVKAPASATIVVRCRRHRCPRRSVKRGRGMRRAVRFKRFERSFRAGTYIEVLVERPGTIGKFTRFRIRRRHSPARKDLCLIPGSNRGSACPEA
jgi:hypothetical protein